jgi:uncharacterized membrane protein YdjX (TVP38/TMEM64 family)
MKIRNEPNFALIFICIGTILSMFFVPISWLTIISGILFGFCKGFGYTLISASLSCTMSFVIGRLFKKDLKDYIYKKFINSRWDIDIEAVSKRIEDSGLKYMFILRNIPLLPFTLVNYISGLSSIRFKDYLIGSILGMIPGIAIAVYLFSRAIDFTSSPKEIIFSFILASIYYSTIFFMVKKYNRSGTFH